MARVRMFCDWDNDSQGLIDRLREQTDGFIGNDYKGINFVTDDTYTHAVCFNFPDYDLKTPAENNIALILEPPELVDTMFRGKRNNKYTNVREIFSFAADKSFTPAFGLGFATAPDLEYTPFTEKPYRMCMIASDKLMTPYHHKRQSIRKALLETDLPIAFYGRGLQGDDPRIMGEIPPMRKHEILNQFQMCIDFENSPYCVVTDKFYDPVICNTMPISNASVLHSYVDMDSFYFVSFDLPIKEIVAEIEDLVNEEPSGEKEEALLSAKHQIRSGNLCLAEWIYRRIGETL